MLRHALAFLCVVGSIAAQTRPQHDGSKTAVFGNLHAHSSLSDDVHTNADQMSPFQAFSYAQAHGLDFLAISDHDKAVDCAHRLFMEPGEYAEKLFKVAMDYNTAHPGQFIAIPAIEWGNTATGNHLNIFGARTLPPDTILDAEYDDLYAWAKEHAVFVQWNHPNSWKGKSNRNKSVGYFGEALFEDIEAFRKAVDPSVACISITCTVYKGHISGPDRHSEAKVHREMQWESYYQEFLNRGFHISPTANQDTHWKNWGTVTAARTGVWVDGVSYEALVDAVKANRVFASEDDELAVAYQVRSGGKTFWIGEQVPLSAEEADVEVLVTIKQGVGAGGDDPDEGPYTIEVLSDWDGVGGRATAVWAKIEHLSANETHVIPLQVVAGEYIYLRVTEENGKDNLKGDGDDEFIAATGEHGSDGLRDDPNDSAWTSPCWFVATSEVDFVWSKNSKLYHDPDCWAVKRIGAANLRTGGTAGGDE